MWSIFDERFESKKVKNVSLKSQWTIHSIERRKKNTGTNRFDKKSSNQNTADKTKQVLTA